MTGCSKKGKKQLSEFHFPRRKLNGVRSLAQCATGLTEVIFYTKFENEIKYITLLLHKLKSSTVLASNEFI